MLDGQNGGRGRAGGRRGRDGRDEGGVDAALPFPLKGRVKHSKWGEGTVLRYEEDKIVVLFEEEGVKSMVTQFVIENALLERPGDTAPS